MASRGDEMLKYQADIRVKTHQQGSTRDSHGDNFTSTRRPLLLFLAAVGLYFPAINKHEDGWCRKTALLVHRLYCVSLGMFLWMVFGYGLIRFKEYVSLVPFIMGVMQYLSSSQTVLTFTVFMWSSFCRRFDDMISAFDLIFPPDMASNERSKLKNIVILVILLSICAVVLSDICVFLALPTMSSEWDAWVTTPTNYTLKEIIPEFSNGRFMSMNYMVSVCSWFAIIVPTALFCFSSYCLSSRFEIVNQNIKKILIVDVSDNCSDICHHLLCLRNEHAQICNAVRKADCLFSPFLLLEFTCAISSVCIVLMSFLQWEETSIWMYIGLLINLLSMILLVLFSSMVHDKVNKLC